MIYSRRTEKPVERREEPRHTIIALRMIKGLESLSYA